MTIKADSDGIKASMHIPTSHNCNFVILQFTKPLLSYSLEGRYDKTDEFNLDLTGTIQL